jgi:MYXO-CTERM domain-containing protein
MESAAGSPVAGPRASTRRPERGRGRAVTIALAALLLAGMQTRDARADATAPRFVGTFSDFNSPAWRSQWGIVPDTLTCKIAVGSASCNWGYGNLKAVDEPGTPGGGQALRVGYPAPSGPPSCSCGIGGAQLYQDLSMAGMAALVQSPTIDLKYYYNFPVGFDFGKNTGGKMPGLYGGPPGCESGGVRCDKAWSTRYMWRGGSASAPRGEVYFYTASGSGFGEDLGLGSWNWQADGKWHSIEQLVNLTTGKIVVWHDGVQKFTTTQKFGDTPLTGIFFSTFHGGHDTSWSPSHATAALFANFTLSTDGPQPDGMPVPGVDAGAGGGAGDASAADVNTPSGSGGAGGATGGAGGANEGGSGGTGGNGGTSVPGASGGSSGSAGGGTISTGGTGSTPTPTGQPPASEPAHTGCSYAATSSPSRAPAATVVLAALGLALARRRRRS